MASRGAWLVIVIVLAACADRPADEQRIGTCEVSSTGPEGPWRTIETEGWTGVGVGAPGTWLKVVLPAAVCDDPVLVLDGCRSLVSARIGGRDLPFNPSYCFWLPVARSDAGATVELQLEGGVRRMWGISLGCMRSAVKASLHQDLLQFSVGSVCFLVGLFVLLSFLLRRSEPALAALGGFLISLGFVSIQQSPTLALLTGVPWRVMDTARHVFTFCTPLFFVLFVRLVLAPHLRPLLRALTFWTLGVLGLVVLAHLAGLKHLDESVRFAHLSTLLVGALCAAAIVIAARRGVDDARALAVGFIVLFTPAIHDLMLGLGFPLVATNFNLAPFGLLGFATAAFVIVQNKFQRTRAQLKARVEELERNRREVESLNDELRHQVEQRSRELQALMSMSAHGATSTPSAMLTTGEVIAARYRVVRRLGSGAMGAVYEVERITDSVRFALKVMSGTVSSADAARFAREAEMAAKLKHPNLVAVVDVGHVRSGVLYLVMELVEGTTLEKLRSEFGHADWALSCLKQVAAGLAAMHQHGIVHRDLKPANVLVAFAERGVIVRIADFGLARPNADSSTAALIPREVVAADALDATSKPQGNITQAGALVGTPLYMSPELVRGEGAGFPADIFAFGLMAYELLTGRYPLRSPPYLTTGPIEPLGLKPLVSPQLAQTLERTLATASGRPLAVEVLAAFTAELAR